MITMILGGLWHGAAWNFVLWGGLHGTGLVAEHALDGRIGRRTPAWLRWLGTFVAVCFGWILFRSTDLGVFWAYCGRLVDPGPATLWTIPVVLMVVLVIGTQLLPPRPLERLQLWIERQRPAVLAIGLAIVILIVGATVPSQGVPPFIYFQF
jgi:alginate O-acetyltransferase complex protein AlgI